MINFEKILDKIYAEKEIGTNIAIFIGAIAALVTYYSSGDATLIIITSVACFSSVKAIVGISLNVRDSLRKKSDLQRGFSEQEKKIIAKFTSKGTTFITYADYRKGKLEGDALDSLVARGVIEFWDRSFGDGPSGFMLKEEIYRSFL